jgi:integrase
LRWVVAQVQVEAEVWDVIIWFCTQDGRWAASTIRQYRAAIAAEVERVMVDASWRESLLAQLRNYSPAPKVGGPRCTSARKRKSVPETEVEQVAKFLKASGTADDLLIARLMLYGVHFFLRPGEWIGVRFEGTMFVAPNAKNTNGRGNGPERERDLSRYGADRIANLKNFLARLEAAAKAAGGWARLHGRLAARLARVCKRLGIRRIAFYTFRHLGIATAKRTMPAEEVAACAGHASVLTAGSHYAKSRCGWLKMRSAGPPSQASLALVCWPKSPSQMFQPKEEVPVWLRRVDRAYGHR